MINPKTAPQSHPHRVLDPPSFTGTPGSKPARVLPQDKIRERVYKLYEDRGREHGHAEQDWIRAEQELRSRA
jgi:DUF2934 family protein